MVRKKQEKQDKHMFKSYNADEVPDTMPFPELVTISTTKGQVIPVPKLNEYQRSWILDVALRNKDLPALTGAEAKTFYTEVKSDAFLAKAFQHTPQPGDRAEEARLAELVKKRTKSEDSEDDGEGEDDSDNEEDEGARVALLRGYPKAGWHLAIQKVISNKRSDLKRKGKTLDPGPSMPDAAVMGKLLGITTYSGRDKFRDTHRADIHAHSKSLPGENAGGKFRKAEGMLWEQEDHAAWESAAANTDDVDWDERQKLVAVGFQKMVDTLHNSGKFRPLVAMMLVGWLPEDGKNVQLEWVEAVPGNIRASQSFEKAHPQLVSDNLNAMYAWADKPLKNFDTSLKRSAEGFPVFPLSPEALDDTSPKTLAQTVTSFLRESYETAFGSPEIPWASVASHPDKYYDTDKFQFDFPSSGLAELTRMQWDTLATALALRAGKGTSGFFRPAATVTGEEAEEVRRMRDEEARREQEAEDEAEARRRQAEEDEARRTQAEAEAEQAEEAHRKQVEEEAEAEARRKREAEAEAHRKEAEEEEVRHEQEAEAEAEVRRKQEEEEEARHEQEAEVRRKQEEEKEARHKWEAEEQGGAKKGRKRKAVAQLVPEEAGAERRTGRKRLTPEEARLARERKQAATVATAKKPSYEYVEKSPVKAQSTKKQRT